MPRAAQSIAGSILKFFQSQPLETAQVVLSLVQDAMRDRQKKSTEAKARVAKPAVVQTSPTIRPPKGKARLTAKAKTRRTRKPKDVPLPLEAAASEVVGTHETVNK